jgi:hypothetical protein
MMIDTVTDIVQSLAIVVLALASVFNSLAIRRRR